MNIELFGKKTRIEMSKCKSQKLRELNVADRNMHHTAQLEKFWGNVGNEEEKTFKSLHSRAKNVMQFNVLKQIFFLKEWNARKILNYKIIVFIR